MEENLPATTQDEAKLSIDLGMEKCFAKVFFANPMPMICVRISDRKVLLVNESYLQLSGYTREALSEIDPRYGLAPKQRRIFYQKLLEGHTIKNLEATLRFENRICQVLLSADQIILTNEPCALVSVQDITEHKRTETILRDQEEWTRQVLESVPHGIVLTNKLGQITMVNIQTEKLFGYDRAELIGQPVENLIPNEKRSHHGSLRTSYMSNPQVRPMHTLTAIYGQRKDGSTFPLEIGLNPINTSAGIVVLCTLLDITDRLKTEAALRKSQENYRLLIENADDIIYLANLEGRFTFANPTALRMLRYTAEEVIGHYYLELVHPDHSEKIQTFYGQQFAERIPNTYFEFKALTKDNREIWLGQKVQLIFENNNITGFQAVARDITERINLESQLKHAHDAALATSRLKSEFLANMSHEIRTPMNGVIGMTDVLLDTQLTSGQREYVETIKSSSETLLTVINDILDFSKIEAGKLTIETLDFDLSQVLEQTIEMFAEQARAKGLELGSHVLPHVPRLLRGDPVRLRQVLTNLLGNAIKFTETGEVFAMVECEAQTSDLVKLRFTVKDTGIGIAHESQKLLFQPFTQADGSTTRKYGGTGLGLAISAQLVGLMGGKIGVQSEPQKGTSFWFTIQVAKQISSQSLVPMPEIKLSGLRALIVDDNPMSRAILLSQLDSWEISCEEAGSGVEALQALEKAAAERKCFDMILIDHQMPEMDGIELAQAIKRIPQFNHTPLMLLTTLGYERVATLSQPAGFAACLNKPVRQSQLFDRLTSLFISSYEKDDHEPLVTTVPAARSGAITTKQILVVSEPPQPHTIGQKELMVTGTKRILIVDDNQINRKVGKLQVEGLGYQADLASNGMEAVAAVQKSTYDLILMDCQMPQMDGFAATAAIRKLDEPIRATPIIALTANALQGERERCLAAGMDDYLSKPVKLEALRATFERWIQSPPSPVPVSTKPVAVKESKPSEMFDRSLIETLRMVSQGQEPSVLHSVVATFRSACAQHLETLQEAIQNQQQMQLEQTLQAFKRDCEVLGAQRMIEFCSDLQGCQLAADSGHCQKLWHNLKEELALINEALDAELH